MDRTKDIYGGQDPREVPRYLVSEAAQYLRLPTSTVRAWVSGRLAAPNGRSARRVPPVVRPPEPGKLLTFHNLIETYVLASIRRVHRVPLQKVRKAVRYVERVMQVERPLISQDFLTDGVDLFVQELETVVNVSKHGQAEMLRNVLNQSLARIDRDPKGVLVALFPWARRPDEPRAVEIDPRRAFGRLVIADTGIPTAYVAQRMSAGETIAELAADYNVSAEKIESAIRWEIPLSA